MAYYKERKRNTPIATLIKNYVNKKSGLVSDSREEIQRRFDYLDWKDQKKILPAFLCSCKTDREWASRQMFTLWDDSFIPIVKEIWEAYHETPLSWVVIRYLPIDYIKENMDALSAGRNYFFICQRLIDDSDFCADKERMYESDYLSWLIQKEHDIAPVMVRELFYTQMRKICLGDYKVGIGDLTFCSERDTTLVSLFHCSIIHSMLQAVEHDLHMYELHEQLYEWIDEVSKAVMNAREWFLINDCNLADDIRNKMGLVLMRKYCYEHLDSPFRVEGGSVDTRELDELSERLEFMCRLRQRDILYSDY